MFIHYFEGQSGGYETLTWKNFDDIPAEYRVTFDTMLTNNEWVMDCGYYGFEIRC